MELLKAYYKERFGFDSIVDETGFISYTIQPPICVIQDIYTHAPLRKAGKAWAKAEEVTRRAKEAGCTQLWAEVQTRILNPTQSLKAILAYGFSLVESDSTRIILKKEIGG
jgi:hypothetical protein